MIRYQKGSGQERTKYDRWLDSVHRVHVKAWDIIPLAARDLNLDPILLKKLVQHEAEFVKAWLKRPTSAMLQLYKFGYWIISRPRYYKMMSDFVIPSYRKDPSPENLEELQF